MWRAPTLTRNRAQLKGKNVIHVIKIGHFARCCRNSSSKARRPRGQNPVNNMAATSDSSDSDNQNIDCLNIFTLSDAKTVENNTDYEVRKPINHIKRFYTRTTVEGKTSLDFLIDTGSAINIINLKSFDRINKQNGGHLKLKKTSTKIVTYASKNPSLIVEGKIKLLIESEHAMSTTMVVFL